MDNQSKYTLFLDRDGVINERIPGKYISKVSDFKFKEGIFDCLIKNLHLFKHIIIVTNQQGLSKDELSPMELIAVHSHMLLHFDHYGINIDKVIACSALASEEASCRKPNPGMGLEAKLAFPDIVFSESIMIGDSISDIGFADSLGMKKVLFLGKEEEAEKQLEIQVDKRIGHWDDLNFEEILQ